MTYLLFGVALSLSAVAAWYAIAGLVAIFAAAAIPIAIMGSLLEASKLVVASWLYRNWKEIPRLFKIYFFTALIVLMLLTSMGIFGFLSKAHLDQAVPTGDVVSKLNLIDEKIKIEKENINAARTAITQLDAQVNATLSRSDDSKGAERSIAIRRGQQNERTKLVNEIGASQAKIAKLNEERAPIASEVRKVEAEVGPIKYIAALLYADNPDEDILEKAVRVVILLIVFVFDPLAVLLLVAANWQMKKDFPVVKPPKPKKQTPTPAPTPPLVIPEEAKTIVKEFFKKEEPKVEVPKEEPKKDWEPEIYQRVEEPKKELGRYLAEVNSEVKGIAKDVQDLQKT
jgi:hypothetical protein